MESCDGAANARGDDEQRSGKDERAKHEEQKLVHTLMIQQSKRVTGGRSPAIY